MIRVHRRDEPFDGTFKNSWVLASRTKLKYSDHTFYGHPDDIGTPGHRGGYPLPVQLSKFSPKLIDENVIITWINESETDNAGFNILRSESKNGTFTQVNQKLILGQGTTGERTEYQWKDTTAKPNTSYYYQIEDVSFSGDTQIINQSHLKGFVSAKDKITTTWSEMKKLF